MSSRPPADASNVAIDMLEIFASVGAEAFDITHTNIDQERRGFRPGQSLQQARTSMPYLVTNAPIRQNNVIIRPRSSNAALIQLDDLTDAGVEKVRPAAFLILETSPGNHQAWVAVSDSEPGFMARLRKGTGADRTASGATRVAGTVNYKRKYEPNFPTVQITDTRRGHVVTKAQLEAMGIVAAADPVDSAPPLRASSDRPRTHKWPSYEEVLVKAPIGPSGNAQRTSVDFTWCKIAASWGHSVETIAARLMQESTKAQENGEKYAKQTAERAAFAAARRNQLKPRP